MDEGCLEINSAHRQAARGGVRTHSPGRRTVRRPPGCPAVGPSGHDAGIWATCAWGSEGTRVGETWATRDGARRGGRAVGGRAVRDPAERSVLEMGSGVDPVPGSRTGACGQRGSR